MKKLIIATSIAFALNVSASATVFASSKTSSHSNNEVNNTPTKQEERNNELIGFGSGAVTGGLIGGPLGAIIGGVFGIFIAEDINSDAALDRTQMQLAQAQSAGAQQQQSLLALQSELDELQQQQMLQLVSYEQNTSDDWLDKLRHFETNLQFKTASFVIENTYKAQLDSLATILSSYPQLRIKVTGFADQRGDSDYNQQLSKQRAEAVVTYLSTQNVSSEQMRTVAAGEELVSEGSFDQSGPSNAELLAYGLESPTAQAKAGNAKLNAEDLFFSRRVNISLITPKEDMTAAN